MPTDLSVLSNKFITPVNKTDYYEPRDIKRRWEVNYGYKSNVYLTDGERDYFVKAIAQGGQKIQIGDLTLSMMFKTIIPLHSKEEVDEYLRKQNEPNPWQ